MTIEMNVSDRRWKELSVPVQDAKVLRQEAIEAHHDHLITEIESTEGSLATTLRYITSQLYCLPLSDLFYFR